METMLAASEIGEDRSSNMVSGYYVVMVPFLLLFLVVPLIVVMIIIIIIIVIILMMMIVKVNTYCSVKRGDPVIYQFSSGWLSEGIVATRT